VAPRTGKIVKNNLGVFKRGKTLLQMEYYTVGLDRIPELWTCPTCTLSQLPFRNVRELNKAETNIISIDVPEDFTSPNLTKLNLYRKHLSVAHLNTQSIMSTFSEFETMLIKTFEFNVI